MTDYVKNLKIVITKKLSPRASREMKSGKMMSFCYLTWDIPIQTTFLTFSHEPGIVGG